MGTLGTAIRRTQGVTDGASVFLKSNARCSHGTFRKDGTVVAMKTILW